VDGTFLLGSLPEEALADIQAAWEEIADAAKKRRVDLRLGR
jgi:hypothetical protein